MTLYIEFLVQKLEHVPKIPEETPEDSEVEGSGDKDERIQNFVLKG